MADPTVYYDGPTVTKAEAKARGLKRYFLGVACAQMHIAERHVSSNDCVVCSSERTRKWRADDPAKARNSVNKSNRKRYAANLERERERGRKYREDNREKDRERHRLKYLRDREHYLDYCRRYHAEHPWKMREKNHRRRAREAGSGGSFTEIEAQALFARQRKRCAVCGQKISFAKAHRDHITPIALGGSSQISNIQITCARCNREKGAKDPIEFARQRGQLL